MNKRVEEEVDGMAVLELHSLKECEVRHMRDMRELKGLDHFELQQRGFRTGTWPMYQVAMVKLQYKAAELMEYGEQLPFENTGLIVPAGTDWTLLPGSIKVDMEDPQGWLSFLVVRPTPRGCKSGMITSKPLTKRKVSALFTCLHQELFAHLMNPELLPFILAAHGVHRA